LPALEEKANAETRCVALLASRLALLSKGGRSIARVSDCVGSNWRKEGGGRPAYVIDGLVTTGVKGRGGRGLGMVDFESWGLKIRTDKLVHHLALHRSPTTRPRRVAVGVSPGQFMEDSDEQLDLECCQKL